MKTRNVAALIAATLMISGCSAPQADTPEPRRPQQAGQPIDPLRTASHIAGARLSAITGDQAGVQRNMQAFSEDMRRAMKLADGARPIDREAARSIARALPGGIATVSGIPFRFLHEMRRNGVRKKWGQSGVFRWDHRLGQRHRRKIHSDPISSSQGDRGHEPPLPKRW